MSQVPDRWFYAYVDLSRREDPEDGINFGVGEFIETVLPKLRQAEYNVVVLSSYHLASHLVESTANDMVWSNLREIAAAAAQGPEIEVIPEVFPIGSSGSLLANDANLAEGVPVIDCHFEVRRRDDGSLFAQPRDGGRSLLCNGNFAAGTDPWQRYETGTTVTTSDPPPGINGRSLEFEFVPDKESHVELGQNFAIKAHHQHQLSYWVRTSELDSESGWSFYIQVSGCGPDHNWMPLERVSHPVESTQGWRRQFVVFNSYACTDARVWFGFNGVGGGSASVGEIAIKEVAGLNLLRRYDPVNPDGTRGLPVEVRSEDGKVYIEGTDFKWETPDVNTRGDFDHNHDVAPIEIPSSGSDISEGVTLKVSYYHAALPHAERHRVCCSLRHPRVLELLTNQAKLVHENLAPRRWLINHDEVWAFGHDPLSAGDSPAQLLGENLNTCIGVVQAVDPDAEFVLPSDMYDPYHGALPETSELSFYPIVNGSYLGSWRYLPEGITIWNWSLGEVADVQQVANDVKASFRHFDFFRCPQVVGGFYDVTYGNDKSRVERRAIDHFNLARHSNVQIEAVCYYTTQRNVDFINEFSDAAAEVWASDL